MLGLLRSLSQLNHKGGGLIYTFFMVFNVGCYLELDNAIDNITRQLRDGVIFSF